MKEPVSPFPINTSTSSIHLNKIPSRKEMASEWQDPFDQVHHNNKGV
jgi:hypothetical protein